MDPRPGIGREQAGRRRFDEDRTRFAAAAAVLVLPIGGTIGLAAALASVTLLFGSVVALFLAPPGWLGWWIVGWCFAAGTGCAWIAVTSTEMVGALDHRPLPRIAAVTGLIVATSPFWWR